MSASTPTRPQRRRYTWPFLAVTLFMIVMLDLSSAHHQAIADTTDHAAATATIGAYHATATHSSVRSDLKKYLPATEMVATTLIKSASITEMTSTQYLYLPAIEGQTLPTPILTYTPQPSYTPQSTKTPPLSPTPPAPTVAATPTPTATPTSVPTATPTSTPTPHIDVFVDASVGSDTNPGTADQPWKTIQKAANTMWPGSTVLVRTGEYPERVQVRGSGAAGAPVTYLAGGEVKMNGFTVSADYINISGFDISNTPDDWREGWGIFVEGSNCTVENNSVHFATQGGIITWVNTAAGKPSTSTMHNVIRNNRLFHNGMTGIEVQGRNNLVEGNEIAGTLQKHPKASNPPGGGDANGINFHGIGNVIRQNYIHDIQFGIPENPDPHIDCFQTYADAWHEAAQNVVIERNLCYNMQAQSLAEMGQGVMIEESKDLLIRNNIFKTYISVYASTANERLKIYNNTFVSSLAPLPSGMFSSIYLTNSPGTSIKNNVFYDFPAAAITIFDSTSKQGLDVGHNVVYRSDGRTPMGSPYPSDLWAIDPQLADPAKANFKLTSGSPAIDAGVALPEVENDYDGVLRPQKSGYDIGAYEYLN